MSEPDMTLKRRTKADEEAFINRMTVLPLTRKQYLVSKAEKKMYTYAEPVTAKASAVEATITKLHNSRRLAIERAEIKEKKALEAKLASAVKIRGEEALTKSVDRFYTEPRRLKDTRRALLEKKYTPDYVKERVKEKPRVASAAGARRLAKPLQRPRHHDEVADRYVLSHGVQEDLVDRLYGNAVEARERRESQAEELAWRPMPTHELMARARETPGPH